jgi:hypothetical protein
VTWRIFVRASAESDFEGLDPLDRAQLAEGLFAWVDHGPPRHERRDVLGLDIFNKVIRGCRVTYYVDEAPGVVLVIRIRRVRTPPSSSDYGRSSAGGWVSRPSPRPVRHEQVRT